MKRSKVKDGYLKDLPDNIQKKIIDINKIIKDEMYRLIDKDSYSDLKSSSWAMSCIDDFCTKPGGNTECGSVRVYKNGKKYECMIQVTGHFTNHQYGWIETLLSELINDLFQNVRGIIRKKYDVKLDNESSNGESYEGFDIYLSNKESKEIWDLFFDRRERIYKEAKELYESYDIDELEYLLEKSHSKLKYDFRLGFDYDTGHAIKIVYSLDDAKIDMAGGAYKNKEYGHKKSEKNIELRTSKETTDKVKKTINKKGDPDHASHGQKVLAIIDRKTGERLKESRVIGLFYLPARSSFKYLELTKSDKSYIEKNVSKDEFPVVKVGEIDDNSSFKTTKLPKGKLRYTDFEGEVVDKTSDMISGIEHLKYARGAKMDDINSRDAANGDIVYNHPSKKDKKRNPEYYENAKINNMIGDIVYNHPSKKDKKRNPEYYENAKMNNMIAMLNGITTSDFNLNDFYESFRESLNDIYEHADMIVISDNINKITESVDPESNPDYKKEYNTDMTEKQAKATLRTLSQDIINKTSTKDNKYKMSQYTANIYANIITKNLLPKWANGFKKFTITLNSYQSYNTLEFKIPTMSQDFIARFVDGREPINAFLHRIPEIKIKMSPRIFHTMKNPDDAFNFFKAAIQYYDSKIEKYAKHLTSEIMKMNHNLKHLVSTTKLSGLVIYPMKLLFVFDDVKMDNKDTFKISQEDINTINRFIRGIYSKYASPENEKKKIVDDVKEMVKALREACDDSDNMRELSYLSEAIDDYYHNKFNDKIKDSESKFISENIDHEGMMNADKETKAMYEKFFVKKLKKIPSDLVAYISIETEAIKDANDKMMIASYCLGKLEIVEWYIELLEVGSNKYVVPHTKPQLEAIRTQLLACYKKIMATPIPKADRPIIDIKYPAGYEG